MRGRLLTFPGRDTESAGAVGEVLRSMQLVAPANLLGLPAATRSRGPVFREDLGAQAIEDRRGTQTPIA